MKPDETSFFSEAELSALDFKAIGKSVRISRKASFYNLGHIEIGDNSRIDDFCVISAGEGGVYIGRNVHIAVYTSLIGQERIVIEDYANISSRVSVYSSNDDYSGNYLTNPTVDAKYTNVTNAPVHVGRHVIVGSGSIILPGVSLADGACIGALSLVNKSCGPFSINGGIPVHFIRERSRGLEEKYAQMVQDGPHS